MAAAVAALAGVVALSCTPAALAAGQPNAAATGTIDGNLVNGTMGNAPIAGQTVTLLQQTGANDRQVATSVTDSQGLFHFAQLAADPADVYVATVQFQGALYSTDPLTLAGNPNPRVTLLAYDATNSDARIGITQVTILLRKPDVPAGTIGVAELVSVVNGDQRTYVGTPGPADGKPMDLLRFALPAGATDLVTSDGFGQGQLLQVDRGFATTTPVLPGTTRFAFTYSYPYASTRSLFTYQAIYPTLQVVLLAPPDIKITAPDLTSQGTISVSGSPVQVWQGQNVPAGSAIEAALSQLPPPGQPSDLNLALLYWLAGILAALAFGLVAYHLVRVRPAAGPVAATVSASVGALRRRPSTPANSKGSASEAGSAAAPDEGSTAALLAALARLDRAREAGKLDEERYRARRAAVKGELRARLLAEAEPPAVGGGR